MNKRRHVPLIVIFSILGALLIAGAVVAIRSFPKPSIEIDTPEKASAESVTHTERLVGETVSDQTEAGGLSGRLRGVTLDLSSDVPADSAEAAAAAMNELFLYYKNFDPDTVFLLPDPSDRFAGMTRADGAAFDPAAFAVLLAENAGWNTVMVVEDGLLVENGLLRPDRVDRYLSGISVDALLFAPTGGNISDSFYDAAAAVRSYLKGSFPGVWFGCAFSSLPQGKQAEALSAFLQSQSLDFVCAAPSCLTTDAPVSFEAAVTGWNGVAAACPAVSFYCLLPVDRITRCANPSDEIAAQVALVNRQENFSGRVYWHASLLRNSSSAAHRVSKICYNEDNEGFAVTTCAVAADNSAVTLGGTAGTGAGLISGRTVVDPDGGPFAVSFLLSEGRNVLPLRSGEHSVSLAVEKIGDSQAGGDPSPYRDNGKGRALMCRVEEDAAPAVASSGDYDTYHPDDADLPAGTLDYVKAITGDGEGLRYELQSGVSVFAGSAALLVNAFALPDNTVSCLSARDEERATVLTFRTDWAAPVSLSLAAQPYRKGYRDFSYNIDSFSSQYLDLVFHYTKSIDGAEVLSFGDASAVASAQVTAGTAGNAVLRLTLKDASRFYGARVSRDVNGNVVVTVKKKAPSLTGAKVMLDPGHGGLYMTGTALNDGSLSEKEVTLVLAQKVAAMLRAQGVEVALTRESDYSLTLEERRDMCRDYDPDVFVSIHCDGVDDMGQSGTHSFYYKPYSQPLAASVHRRLVDVYANVIYTSMDKNYDQIDKRIKYYPFYVTRVDQCPSILVESGFMSNDFEGRILADDNCRNWIADAITQGIVDFLTS